MNNLFLFKREGFEPAEGEPANITAYQGQGSLEDAESVKAATEEAISSTLTSTLPSRIPRHHLYSIVTEVSARYGPPTSTAVSARESTVGTEREKSRIRVMHETEYEHAHYIHTDDQSLILLGSHSIVSRGLPFSSTAYLSRAQKRVLGSLD